MSRSNAFLLATGLMVGMCVSAAFSARPCLAMPSQDPPTARPNTDDSDPPPDEPIVDEPPFDEPPPGRGQGRRHPDGPQGAGRGPGCDHSAPGCMHQDRGPGDDEAGPRCDEMCLRFLGIIKEKLPEHYEKLSQLRTENPRRFDGVMRRLRPVVREYLDLVEEEPALAETIFEDFRIDERLRELGHAYREAKDRSDADGMAKLEKEIRSLVEKQAEMSIARREARLRVLERRLKKQLERLQQHQERFKDEKSRLTEFVDDRVQDVMEGRPPRGKGRHGRGGRFGPGERGRQADEARHRRGGEGRRDRRDRRERMRDDPAPASEPQEESSPTTDE